MKRIVFVCVALLMASLAVMAEKHPFSNGLYWELNGTTLTVSGKGPMKDDMSPWRGEGRVEKFVIEDGVTSIGSKIFSHYKALITVNISNSVTSIGEYAFNSCVNLTTISIPNSVTTIGEHAFAGCCSLTSISIPNSVKSIGACAFAYCTNLTYINIPNSVTTIGGYAFSGCTSLTNIKSLPIWVIEGGEMEWERLKLSKDAVYKYISAHPDMEVRVKGGYSSVKLITNGDVEYYIVSKNNHYGLTDANGHEIVPTELNAIEQCGIGFLRFKVGDFWGVMNYTGKIIIPTDRGYTKIGDYVSFTKRFPYEMDGFKGECNNLGQQVSKIKVTTPQKETAMTSTPTPKTTSSTTTSSSTTASNSSKTEKQTESKTQTVVVEHRRDPIPVQEWQPCGACSGSGQCPFAQCGGSGWYYVGNRRMSCPRCNGSGKCTVCAGRGGQNVTVYR